MNRSQSPPPPPAPQQDVGTISYARPLDGAATFMPVRPTWLVGPHLLAVSLMFLPFADHPPIGVLARFVRGFRGGGTPSLIWDAMVSGPFLLALPLAVWTIRLLFPRPPSRGERGAAWAVACAMLAPLVLVLAFVATQLPRFLSAFGATLIVLAIGSAYVVSLRRLAWSYVPALAAMSFIFLANTVLIVLAVLSRNPQGVGTFVGLIFIALEAVALLILWLRWRREIPAI